MADAGRPDAGAGPQRQAADVDDWDACADITVALLRAEAGRYRHERGLCELTGELCTVSGGFRTRRVSAHEAHSMTFCTAQPGTAYEDRLELLASRRAGPAPMRMVGGPCSCAPLSGPCDGRTTREIIRCARGAHTPRARRTSRAPGTTPGRRLVGAHAAPRHLTPPGAAALQTMPHRAARSSQSAPPTSHGTARHG
ncbi:hypothetical protein [Streptomyces sp. NPDC013187]|uniref:MmyB family transcriptional regulator n=1 Tax=Streptomyces sp. NPDC013187 TaxID=3364865 RepID=UPI00369D9814